MHVLVAVTTIHLSSTLLSMLSGVVIPILVGIITKLHASDGLKGLLNAMLSAVAGAIATAASAGGTVNWEVYLFNIGLTWATSIATFYGLWKSTGVADAIARLTAEIGFGRRHPPPPAPPPQVVNRINTGGTGA